MANEASGLAGVGGNTSSGMSAAGEATDVGAGTEESLDAEVMHYYFPVEIEVRNDSEPIDKDSVVAETLRRLTEGLRGV